MPQTSILVDPPVAFEGMLSDSGPMDVLSRALATAAGIGAGRLVSYATSTTCKAPAAAADLTPGSVALGISIKQSYISEPGSPDYKQYEMVSILAKGRIWLKCSTAVAVTDAITFVYSGADAGLPCVSGTANSAALGIGSVKCITPAGIGALGQFEVNIP